MRRAIDTLSRAQMAQHSRRPSQRGGWLQRKRERERHETGYGQSRLRVKIATAAAAEAGRRRRRRRWRQQQQRDGRWRRSSLNEFWGRSARTTREARGVGVHRISCSASRLRFPSPFLSVFKINSGLTHLETPKIACFSVPTRIVIPLLGNRRRCTQFTRITNDST